MTTHVPSRLFLCALVSFSASSPAAPLTPLQPSPRFESAGLGGGGAMYVPVCSPHDHNLMFVACDMGGVYRSTDGGQSWQMLDKRVLRHGNECPITFDPIDPDRMYAASGSELRLSNDRGEYWRPLAKSMPWKGESIVAIGVEPTKAETLLIGTRDAVWTSPDRGATWTKASGAPGAVISFVFDSRSAAAGRIAFAGAKSGVFRTQDAGLTWQEVSSGLPAHELRGFSGGCDAEKLALYCALPGTDQGGKYAGGVFLSLDDGTSWSSAMGEGINTALGKQDRYGIDEIPQYRFLSGPRTQPGTVFVTTRGTGYHPPYHWTVYRSDDFGKTWVYCLTADPREKLRNVEDGWLPIDINLGFGGPASGFSVCENDPRIAMFTNSGELYLTRDGAKSWQCAYSQKANPREEQKPGLAWQSCGLEVTSCWQFVFDPHEKNRVYTCYTDIGFARSEDGGKSWRHSVQGSPWANSFYQIALDPDRAGVIYAACANQHDIPTWTNVDKVKAGGGVCLSTDFGVSWKPRNKGLPDAPVTSIVLDPRSPPASRALYAAVFGHGVYKSTDDGATWTGASEGLGLPVNRHAYSVKLDPEGKVYCSITGERDGTSFADGSGLYRSPNGGKTWEKISPPLQWAGDFDLDPRDSRTIYLTASTPPGHSEGGLYKTTDAGVSWTRLIKDADLPQELGTYIHAFFISVDPQRPDRLYFSAHSHGLFVSEDRGGHWREIGGIPFTAVNRVTVDPANPSLIYATTFGGGVWKGDVGTSIQSQ